MPSETASGRSEAVMRHLIMFACPVLLIVAPCWANDPPAENATRPQRVGSLAAVQALADQTRVQRTAPAHQPDRRTLTAVQALANQLTAPDQEPRERAGAGNLERLDAENGPA